jgi:hypothetical protein
VIAGNHGSSRGNYMPASQRPHKRNLVNLNSATVNSRALFMVDVFTLTQLPGVNYVELSDNPLQILVLFKATLLILRPEHLHYLLHIKLKPIPFLSLSHSIFPTRKNMRRRVANSRKAYMTIRSTMPIKSMMPCIYSIIGLLVRHRGPFMVYLQLNKGVSQRDYSLASELMIRSISPQKAFTHVLMRLVPLPFGTMKFDSRQLNIFLNSSF